MVWLAGAPLEISEDLITTFNISLVVRGTVSETSADQHDKDTEDLRYRTPKANNMFRYSEGFVCPRVCGETKAGLCL